MDLLEYLRKTCAEQISSTQSWHSKKVEYEIALLLNSGYLLRPAHIADQARDRQWTAQAIQSLVQSIQTAYSQDILIDDLKRVSDNII